MIHMPISNMSESESQLFQQAYELYSAGRHEDAIQKLRELEQITAKPADKAGVLYHEVLWLIESGKVSRARERLTEMEEQVMCIDKTGSDTQSLDLKSSLDVMTQFAEGKLLIAEGNEDEASRVLDELVSRYQQKLSLPDFRETNNEVNLLRGVLLADRGKWLEARTFLEDSFAPSGWEGFLEFYRGRFYYEVRDFVEAKKKFLQALEYRMIPKWEAWARYMLGRVYFHFSEFFAAKTEFEKCLKIADPQFVAKMKVLEWLESTSREPGSIPNGDKRVRGEPGGSAPN
jgi:tetratricopeptide (TPR) repeat protein